MSAFTKNDVEVDISVDAATGNARIVSRFTYEPPPYMAEIFHIPGIGWNAKTEFEGGSYSFTGDSMNEVVDGLRGMIAKYYRDKFNVPQQVAR